MPVAIIAFVAAMKIGPNARCPCGSGLKFKRCCDGKLDWIKLFNGARGEAGRHMSVRGKNQAFLSVLRSCIPNPDFASPAANKNFKAHFTPELTHLLFLSVQDLWPDQADAKRALTLEKDRTSGLYIGDYDLSSVLRGVTRHSLYADSILLMDPFPHPQRFKPELNPLQHPDIHVTNAIQGARLWFAMAPWIDAGIVRFIHAPPYFDYNEYVGLLEQSRRRIKDHPELTAALDAGVAGEMHGPNDLTKYQILAGGDDAFLEFSKVAHPDWSNEQALLWRDQQRAAHPYYVPLRPVGSHSEYSQFFMQSSGGNYDLVKATALQAGAHIITDMALRWRELEFDRRTAGAVPERWQPFAKAIQNAKLGYLDKVTLTDAFRLRTETRLEPFRQFLNKVWRASVRGDPMSEDNSAALASELADKVREAEEEWRKIDRDLLQHFKTYAGLSGAIAWGTGAFLPAAMISVVGGVVDLATAQHRRGSFEDRYPAGFFLRTTP